MKKYVHQKLKIIFFVLFAQIVQVAKITATVAPPVSPTLSEAQKSLQAQIALLQENETKYKTVTGTIIITAKEITNRKVSLLPTISFFIFLKSLKI